MQIGQVVCRLMRPSSRASLLDAAADLARREGIGAVTFESLARESGLSRGGILYHFRSKDALLAAMIEQMVAGWEQRLHAALGKPLEQSAPAERLRAYLATATHPAVRADLALFLDPTVAFDGPPPWQRVIERWTPTIEEAQTSSEMLDLYVARLAADGLWMAASLSDAPIPPRLFDALIERIRTTLVDGANDPTAPRPRR